MRKMQNDRFKIAKNGTMEEQYFDNATLWSAPGDGVGGNPGNYSKGYGRS